MWTKATLVSSIGTIAALSFAPHPTPKAFEEHGYITWRLCYKCITDATTASTTGLTDAYGQYAESLLDGLKLDHWLCEVSKEAAEELGFINLRGVPVIHCCGDNGACSLGAGAGSPGSSYVYLGASGWVAGSFPRSQMQSRSLVPGVFTLVQPDSLLVFKTGSIMTAGGNLAWAASNL